MVETLLLMPFSSHSHSHNEKRGWRVAVAEADWRERECGVEAMVV